MVISDNVEKTDYGIIFFYNSKKHIEAGEIRYALAGNAPFLVEKETEKIVEFGTALPLEEYIKEYQANL
ncbi:YrhB domain-containing protein [Tenacibaculum tangerinum]|uniref:YrhB domain-containing protein n=1 Tax=Tenacibaculum tangerinum TaxID=3038772 RepID=A0ABY8L0Q2_9FLAO|nr:YrhB domain-containing protein [Tenacibaculum tangerinum]WGH74671.1 YrhB domain-containing protein [Tenacibaculum tangerinum]